MTEEVRNKTIESICGLAYKNLTEHFDEIFAKFNALQNKYRKAVLKQNTDDSIFFKPIERKSNGFTYIIYPSSNGKRDFKKYGMIFFLVTPFYVDGKPYYVRYDGVKRNNKFNVYTQHFFDRYIERHLGNESNLSMVEVIKDFLKETDALDYIKAAEGDKYENGLQLANKVGVDSVTKISDNILLHKTFVGNSTIRMGKRQEAKEAFERVKPYIFDANGKRKDIN